MNGDYSSRSMERNCKRDINFMFLLEGAAAPDHATFARFRSIHFAPCSKRILAEVSNALFDLGEISGETIFIDGTKSMGDETVFGRKKKVPEPIYDVTQKIKKTWWGGTKLVPTTKAEQRKMKAEILKRNPKATVLDSKAKKQKELEWIDRIEEFDAFMNG